jgi:GAF domain-containing protein
MRWVCVAGLKILNGQAACRHQEAAQMSATDAEDIKNVIVETFGAIEILARALHVQDARLQPTLDAIVAHAAAANPAAQDAGLILVTGGQLVPQATTGRAPQRLDIRQQDTGEGPCIETARTQTMICISDTRHDTRWPEFCAEAQACGVGSLLCAPLWVSERSLGALTLYAAQPQAFSEHDEQITGMLATLAALALAEAQRTDQLRTAISNRDLGQAKGILMERYKINADAAFSTLSRTSQTRNMKLHELARHVVDTGELPATAED